MITIITSLIIMTSSAEISGIETVILISANIVPIIALKIVDLSSVIIWAIATMSLSV